MINNNQKMKNLVFLVCLWFACSCKETVVEAPTTLYETSLPESTARINIFTHYYVQITVNEPSFKKAYPDSDSFLYENKLMTYIGKIEEYPQHFDLDVQQQIIDKAEDWLRVKYLNDIEFDFNYAKQYVRLANPINLDTCRIQIKTAIMQDFTSYKDASEHRKAVLTFPNIKSFQDWYGL